MQGLKIFRGTNLRLLFSAWVTSPCLAWDQSVSQANNLQHDPFRALFHVSWPIQHEKKHARAKNILQRKFSSGSLLSSVTQFPVQCASTVNHSFLSNHWPFSILVSCFRTELTFMNTVDSQKHFAARHKHSGQPKTFCCANYSQWIWIRPTSPLLCSRTVLSRLPMTIFKFNFMILGENQMIVCLHQLNLFHCSSLGRQTWIRIC
jgi:hypothetical protein